MLVVKAFLFFVKFCLWVYQWQWCPTACAVLRPLSCALWMSQRFPSELLVWLSALNGIGLLPYVLVWLCQDQMKGFEERLSGYDTPAKGVAPRLSLLYFLKKFSNVSAVIFGEKLHLLQREAKTYFTLGKPSCLTEYGRVFLHLLGKNHTCMLRCKRVINSPSLWKSNGNLKESPAPWAETDGTKHMGTSYVRYFTVTWLAFCCSTASPGLEGTSRQDRRLLWLCPYLIFL